MYAIVSVVTFLYSGIPEQTGGHISYIHGNKYIFTITKEQYDKMPTWNLASDNPPLSARSAITLSDPLRNKLIPDNKDEQWKLQGILLKKSGAEKWYWIILYESHTVRISSSGPRDQMGFIVLMDGTVIQPTIENSK